VKSQIPLYDLGSLSRACIFYITNSEMGANTRMYVKRQYLRDILI